MLPPYTWIWIKFHLVFLKTSKKGVLMKDKSTSMIVHGTINVVFPYISGILWFMVITLPDSMLAEVIPFPMWRSGIRILPLLPCPISCIWGIIRSIIYRNSKNSFLYLILSITGLSLFVAMMVMLYCGIIWPRSFWEVIC